MDAVAEGKSQRKICDDGRYVVGFFFFHNFKIYFFFLIEVKLTYSMILVSGAQHDSIFVYIAKC